MSGIYAVLATLLSIATLALCLYRFGAKVWLSLDAAAAGTAICATVSLLDAPFHLLSNPMRFSPQTLAFLFAGLPEEALKMLGSAAFLRAHWRAREPRDVMLAAGALALGFAMLENFLYIANAGAEEASVAASRAATAAPMHVMQGIVGGYVVARAPANVRGFTVGVLTWLALAAGHGLYDFAFFAAKPDAVPTVAFDTLVAALGFDRGVTLRVMAIVAEAATAVAAAVALGKLGVAPPRRRLGWMLAAALIAGALAISVYGAAEAYGADAWIRFASWAVFAVPPFALGLMSLPQRRPLTRGARRGLAGAAAAATCVVAAVALVWGPAVRLRLDRMRAEAQGARLYAQGDFMRSAEAYTRAVEDAPGDAEPLAQRALAYAAERRWDDALKDLDRALGLAPTAALYGQRARLNHMRDRPALALPDLDEAVRREPANPFWLAERATAKIETGDPKGAYADLTQAARLSPNAPEVRLAFAHYRIDDGDLDAAIGDLNARLHDDPHDALAKFLRGRVWFYKGEFARARDDFVAEEGSKIALYPAIWRHLAQSRLHEDAGAALMARFAAAPPGWPAPVARMLLGEIDPAVARAMASDDDERCEADFYFAASRLGEDPSETSAARLRAALAECPTTFIEYEGAKAELRRLAL